MDKISTVIAAWLFPNACQQVGEQKRSCSAPLRWEPRSSCTASCHGWPQTTRPGSRAMLEPWDTRDEGSGHALSFRKPLKLEFLTCFIPRGVFKHCCYTSGQEGEAQANCSHLGAGRKASGQHPPPSECMFSPQKELFAAG